MAATPQGDPLSFIDSWHRLDVNFAVGPVDGNWEIGIYGRDLTDERVWIGAGANSFQHRTTTLTHNPGTVTAERGRRVGIQFNYYLGR